MNLFFHVSFLVNMNKRTNERRALTILKDVPLRIRRVLSMYNVYGNSDHLVLKVHT